MLDLRTDLRSILRDGMGADVTPPVRVDAAVGKRCVETYSQWEDKVRAAVAQVHGAWAKQWVDEQRGRLGGVRSAENEVHEVVVGDAMFPIDVWVTRCGWRFGHSKHSRCPVVNVTCKKCVAAARKAAGQVGGPPPRPERGRAEAKARRLK